MDLSDFRRERGLLWPKMDVDCAEVIFNQLPSIDAVLSHVKDFSLCMQAGGHCGLWPITLALQFDQVVTAEPHPLNFYALSRNIKNLHNITAYNCAVGNSQELVGMTLDELEKQNCGAFRIHPGAGTIAQQRIDGFDLPSCGLIYLDVEGFEELALRGAEQTIKKFLPVIAIEAKGLAKYYGGSDASCAKYITGLGYKEVGRTDNDVIYDKA